MPTETVPTEELIRRHLAFWRGAADDRPVLRVRPYAPLQRGGLAAASTTGYHEGDLVEPSQIPVKLAEIPLPELPIERDLIVGVDVPGLCWTEGAAGCVIRMGYGGAWADRPTDLPSQTEDALRWCIDSLDKSGPWLEALSGATRQLVKRAENRSGTHSETKPATLPGTLPATQIPVLQPLLRGPLDIMASLLGHAEMVAAMVDHATLADRLLVRCTDLFIEVAKLHFSITPPWNGGSVMFGMWNDCPTVRTQLDNAVLVSPTMYRDQISDHYRRVFSSFPASIIHVHSGSLHIIDELLREDTLTAVQVTRDFPAGPEIEDLLEPFARIQLRKPLVMTGPVSRKDLDRLTGELSSTGLCLDVQLIA